MHLSHLLFSTALASLSSAAAIIIPERPGPIIGGFNLATENTCPMDYPQIAQHVNINYGEACGACVPLELKDEKPFIAIQDAIFNPWCHMIVYSNTDCSGTGILTGEGCWSPPGGIAAYRVECPSWPDGPTPEALKPCYESS